MTVEDIKKLLGLTAGESKELDTLIAKYRQLSGEIQDLGSHLEDASKSSRAAEAQIKILNEAISLAEKNNRPQADIAKLKKQLAEAKHQSAGIVNEVATGYKNMFDSIVDGSKKAFRIDQQIKYQEGLEKTIRTVGKSTGLVGAGLDNMSSNLR